MINLDKQLKTHFKIAAATALGVLLLIGLVWAAHTNKKGQVVAAHKISFHLPADVPALQVLINAAISFCQTKGTPLEVKKFYHNQDGTLLKAQVEEALSWDSEAIVTIGNMSAQNTHTILTKRESKIPHLFACVADPRLLGMSDDQYFTKTSSTGIAEDTTGSNDALIRSVRHVRPDAKRGLIFYSNASPTLPTIAASVIGALGDAGIATEGILTKNLEELSYMVQMHVNRDVDIVVILRDALVVSGLQTIIKACRLNGVTAFASDSNSVRNGAVAGCCIEEGEIGLMLGELIIKVIQDKVPAQEIPVTYFNTALLCHTYINPYEMNEQGLHDHSVYDLMKGELKLTFVH